MFFLSKNGLCLFSLIDFPSTLLSDEFPLCREKYDKIECHVEDQYILHNITHHVAFGLIDPLSEAEEQISAT